ncbi:MAG: EAL domain-containing protein [Betaproteobacteria bacterium]
MLRPSTIFQWHRQVILVAVGVLGLLITLWVDSALSAGERDRLEQRFHLAASSRAAMVIKQLCQPLEHLGVLQRLFASVDEVNGPTFKKFTEPMLSQPGIASFMWFPRVAAADRTSFERSAQKLWGGNSAIMEFGSDNQWTRAGQRAVYFPKLFAVPKERGRSYAGFDLYAPATRGMQIDRAIDSNLPTASEVGSLRVESDRSDALLMLAPVYRGGVDPLHRDARRANALGVVAATLHLGDLFEASTARPWVSGFHARLLDLTAASEKQILADWTPRLKHAERPARTDTWMHSEDFEMAGHLWQIQIQAGTEWLETNRSRGLHYVVPFGILVTLVLLYYLHALLRRSALVDSLERSHKDDVAQRKAAEDWANKLFMAVEQNPATVFITDLDGHFEYVNDKFVEITGYLRKEVIGQKTDLLRPLDVDGLIYQEWWEIIRSGESWQGELQTRKRDGTVFWERMLISPIKDSSGTMTHFIAIKEDITELRQILSRMQESESRFRAAMSVMVEGLAVISPDGRIVFANRAAEEFMGCAEGGLLGLRVEDVRLERLRDDGTLCPLSDYPSALTLREGHEVRDAVLGFRRPDGMMRWMQVNTSPLRTGTDDNFGVVVTLSDVTERRRTEEQLRLAFEAIRCSGEGIVVTDADQHIISVNPAFEAVTGYSAAEIAGKTPDVVASMRHDARFYAEIHAALQDTGHWQGEVWNQRKNGEVFPEWLGVSVVRENDGRPKYYVYIFSDMTERKEAQQRIEMLAHHDPLTGLPNRLLLRDRADQAKAQASRMNSRVGLMFLDLDRFKTINDSLGHPVGDALLKEVVERLKSCVRESDTISRQGGDEFIILLNDVRDSEAVSRVAEKIHQRMAEPMLLENHLLNSSFSIGIALYPDDGEDFDILLQKADTAMYHAKEAGRNGHRFFTEEMNQKVVEHLRMETQLRRALEKGEFVLHYQPQIDLHDGRIVGVEALLRWNSPEEGLVSPGKFIPVAEDSGLIVPIGAWVLNEACRQAAAWQESGLPPFVVAVNLSAVQFKRMDLINTVINALVLSELDSEWLELELTESILIQDAEVTLDSVQRLKALGVKLSVDDFGTGYSSLAYLKRFAVDKLKIDHSFVRDLVSDPDDAAIVRAIIQMAHSLKLKTIAEGVESEDLANLLRVFHCDEIQGYWVAKPMPAHELEIFVRTHGSLGGALAE